MIERSLVYWWFYNWLAVCAPDMDLMWFQVTVLISALVFSGQSRDEGTKLINHSCYTICPPGFFNAGDCDNSDKKYRCEKCGAGTFTAFANSVRTCLKCKICGRNQIIKEPCSFNNDTVCDCKPGYVYDNNKLCISCSGATKCSIPLIAPSDYSGYTKKYQSATSVPPPSINLSTAATAVSVTTKIQVPGSKTLNNTSNPAVTSVQANNHMLWLVSVVALTIFLVLFWFLIFCGIMLRNQDRCFFWRPNKNSETPAQEVTVKEHCSHPGSAPTTLTFTISEETPMMSLCQDPPAHICGQMPDSVHTLATRQDVQSDRWPAIVLYAIIKEVPLRRWKEFLRLLSVSDQQMERVELEAGLGSMEKQYQMLRLWSQRSSASLNDVYSSLNHMDLSGCAQLLQESLEKLQWKQRLTA